MIGRRRGFQEASIVAAGYFFNFHLLFSGFQTGAERSVQTAHVGYALVELLGKFSSVAADWRGLDERR